MSSLLAPVACAGLTVDLIDTAPWGGYAADYRPGSSPLLMLGFPLTYHLNDGSTWSTGAGSSTTSAGWMTSFLVQNDKITYTFSLANNVTHLMDYTDFDSGSHSSQGVLDPAGPLTMEATLGGTTGTMRGYAKIASNDMTWYGEPKFNFYSAPVGSLVPFEANYTLTNATWTPTVFDSAFNYRLVGSVDFIQAVPEPSTMALLFFGGIAVMIAAIARRLA